MVWPFWLEELFDIFFPTSSYCLFCWQEYKGSAERGACPRCREALSSLTGPQEVCTRCGRFTAEVSCPNCGGVGLPGLQAVISTVPYEGQYRELVQQLKYNGKQAMARPMGFLMGSRFRSVQPLIKPDLIIPVPLEPGRQLARDYNQSALLAAAVSSIVRCPVQESILFREREQLSQTALNRVERLANIKGAFFLGAGKNIQNKTILLVDDIITTGATLSACAQVLLSGGAKEVWGLTWAAGIRHIPANLVGKRSNCRK